MIRIEIEVCEQTQGKVNVHYRAVQGCWGEPTAGEEEVADAIHCMIERESSDACKRLGDCEEIEGEELERRKGLVL